MRYIITHTRNIIGFIFFFSFRGQRKVIKRSKSIKIRNIDLETRSASERNGGEDGPSYFLYVCPNV